MKKSMNHGTQKKEKTLERQVQRRQKKKAKAPKSQVHRRQIGGVRQKRKAKTLKKQTQRKIGGVRGTMGKTKESST